MSDQFALDFQPHRLYRRTDPDTSADAAKAAYAIIGRHEQMIMDALHDFPHGLTSEEIGDVTNLGQVPVARRLRAMAERKLVIATAERRANRSGRAAIVWRAAP